MKRKEERFIDLKGNKKISLGRNDLCYCGSSKKYKNCCMKRDQDLEILRHRLEQTEEITDKYFNVNEYIKVSGYPLKNIDYFIIETINMIGLFIFKIEEISKELRKELLLELANKALDFINTCEICKNKCIKEPMKKVDFNSLIEKGLKIDELPLNLQNRTALNFFYIEFSNYMASNILSVIKNIADEEIAETIASLFYSSFLNYISENCYQGCNNECINKYDKNAYCKFCMLGEKRLPCPKKGQIDYEVIKATSDDMEH